MIAYTRSPAMTAALHPIQKSWIFRTKIWTSPTTDRGTMKTIIAQTKFGIAINPGRLIDSFPYQRTRYEKGSFGAG